MPSSPPPPPQPSNDQKIILLIICQQLFSGNPILLLLISLFLSVAVLPSILTVSWCCTRNRKQKSNEDNEMNSGTPIIFDESSVTALKRHKKYTFMATCSVFIILTWVLPYHIWVSVLLECLFSIFNFHGFLFICWFWATKFMRSGRILWSSSFEQRHQPLCIETTRRFLVRDQDIRWGYTSPNNTQTRSRSFQFGHRWYDKGFTRSVYLS